MKQNIRQIRQLEKIMAMAKGLISELKKAKPAGAARTSRPKRVRRSGKELAEFRKMLKEQRKAGTPVADLARAHNISAAYIYQL